MAGRLAVGGAGQVTKVTEAGKRKIPKVQPLLTDGGGQLRGRLARKFFGVATRTRTTHQKQEFSHRII